MRNPGRTAIQGVPLKKKRRLVFTLFSSCTSLAFLSIAEAKTTQKPSPLKTIGSRKTPPKIARKEDTSKETKKKSLREILAEPHMETETLYVTGTRLTQSRLSNVMAGSTLSSEQIKRRGYLDLGLALLRENPAVSIPDNAPVGGQNMYGTGQSFVSLLNLGSQRTLTLVDGMRMGGGASASIYGVGSGSQVDISAMPTSLVKTIDTRLGGAGAAYGADAVAGVVNYELDDHYKGVSLNAQGDWSQKLDNAAEKITFKAGRSFDHDRGGLVFDVEYRNQAGMLLRDRPDILSEGAVFYHRPTLGEKTAYTNVLGSGARMIQYSLTGIPTLRGNYGDFPVYGGVYGPTYAGLADAGIPSANGTPLVFSQNGQALVPYNSGTLLQGDNALGVDGDGVALRNYTQMRTPSEKINLTLLGHYDLTPHFHATWQGWYARGSAVNQSAMGMLSSATVNNALTPNSNGPRSSSFFTEGVTNGPLTLSTDNPYLTTAERDTIKAALAAEGLPTDQFYLNRLNQDLDTGYSRTTMQMYRFQGGLHGDFSTLGRRFDWKVRGEYSRYSDITTRPSLVVPNLVNALNAVRAADGTIQCADGYENAPIATGSSVCAPLNPFGFNQMTPAARDYVTALARATNRNSLRDIQAEIGSTILKLPAGDIRWDLGYEHRREAYHFDPGAYWSGWKQADGSALQYGNDTPVPTTGGAYHTHEGFGELDVPLVSPAMHVPGVYHLSLTANGRLTYNSVSNAYWTYMVGASWWPTRDFGISGNYAVSARNPAVGELFAPQSGTYQGGIDPCSSVGLASGPNPALRAANCAKAGITQPFISNFNSYTVFGTAGGNTRLRNEHSKSYTGSLEFRPHFIRGLDMKASYVDVRITDAITYLSAKNLLDACYDSANYSTNAFCSTFQRDSTGQITSFESGYYNIANYDTQALQATLEYTFPLQRLGMPIDAGTIDLQGNYVHYFKNQQNYLASAYPLTGNTASPRDNFTINTTWQRGAFSAQWQTMWYGPSAFMLQVPANTYEDNQRPPFVQFNLALSYDITKNLSTSFVINNVTDAVPDYPGTYSLARYYEALIGRSFQMQIGASF